MPINYENIAVSLCTDVTKLSQMYSLGLRRVHFTDLAAKQAYVFAVKYWKMSNFNEAPSREVLQDNCEVIIEDTDESPQFIVNKLKRRYVKDNITRLMIQATDGLKDDPLSCMHDLSEALWNIRQQNTERTGESDLISSIDDRRKRYEERSKRYDEGGILGETLGFDELDDFTSGMVPGELWIVAAGPKVGKTWYSLQVTKQAMLKGKKVLYFTLEMPIHDMEDRLEALLSGVSYNRLLNGKLSSEEAIKLRKTQDNEKNLGRVLFRRPSYGNRSVENMMHIAREEQPDILIIDQLSWIEADNSNNRAEQVAKIILDLKSAISNDQTFKMPVLLLTQFNRAGASAGELADLSQLALSSEIERTADAVIGMSRTKEQAANNAFVLQIMASRRCDIGKWLVHRELLEKSQINIVRQLVDGDE